MDALLSEIKSSVFDVCGFELTDFVEDIENEEYNACRFKINSKQVFSRSAKITPKKIGQFVTFYKRKQTSIIAPFFEDDIVDFYLVNVEFNQRLGFFIFPKSELIKRGIISTKTKEGKRAFRVYPSWNLPLNKQAIATQKWQLNYFYEIINGFDKNSIANIFQ